MNFRIVAISIFCVGLLSLPATFLLRYSGNGSAINPDFLAATTEVNDANFDATVLASGKVAVVDFYGDYCGVCRAMEPELADLALEVGDTALFSRVNVQQAPGLVERFGVRAVPTLLVIRDGETVFKGQGKSALSKLRAALQSDFES